MKATPLLELFAIEAKLNEEQISIRDEVRKFAREVFAPGVAQWYHDEVFPNEMLPRLGEWLMGATTT